MEKLLLLILLLVPIATNAATPVKKFPVIPKAERQIIVLWLTDINNEKSESLKTEVYLHRSSQPDAAIFLELVKSHTEDLTNLSLQLSEALSSNNRTRAISLINNYRKVKSSYSAQVAAAIEAAARQSENRRQEEFDRIYSRTRQRAQEARQATVNTVNARVSEYNRIIKEGSANGLTEAVVNAQLQNAGLTRQTNCYTSPVGGMTPSGGSITCYTR